MGSHWLFVIDFMTISLFLLLATFLRSKIGFLQKYLIPNNIVAGFLLFIIGLLGVEYLQIPVNRYGKYIYHLLAITFIAMSLRKTEGGSSKSTYATGLLMSFNYAMQAVVGLVIAFLFMIAIKPDLFPTFGYFILLGFGQGPGQAYSIGHSWEPLGFENAANIGLTFAALGYIWAIFIGLLLIRALKKKYGINKQSKNIVDENASKLGVIKRITEQPCAGELTTHNSAIDGFTFQIALVLFVYFITYLSLKGVEIVLPLMIKNKGVVSQVVSILWGLHFIFGSLFGIFTRKIMKRFGWGEVINNGLMTRISGGSLDFMVTAAIAAISISVLLEYITIIAIMSIVGGLLTMWFVVREIRKSGLDSKLERILAVYGTLTGTLSTGLTLTRVVDPDFKTKAAQDVVLGAGIAVPFTLPIMASMIVPIIGLDKGLVNKYFLINLVILSIYTLLLYIYWRYYSKKIKL